MAAFRETAGSGRLNQDDKNGKEASGSRSGAETEAESHGHSLAQGRQEWLAATIEQEIVPRLLMAHRLSPGEPAPQSEASALIQPADITAFAQSVVNDGDAENRALLDAMQARGVSLQELFLGLFAPVARALGTGWEEDDLGFTDVTLGLTRLHRLVHELGAQDGGAATSEERGARILFAPAPHELHTFGMMMTAEMFRQSGWSVWDEPASSLETLKDLVGSMPYHIAGLSVTCDVALEGLDQVIADLRRESCNPHLKIILGGAAIVSDADIVTRAGADAGVTSALEALDVADGLLQQQTNVIPWPS